MEKQKIHCYLSLVFFTMLLLISSCKKTESDIIPFPNDELNDFGTWKLLDNLNDKNQLFISSFVKDDYLYLVSNTGYYMYNKNFEMVKHHALGKTLKSNATDVLFNKDYIIWIDYFNIVISSLKNESLTLELDTSNFDSFSRGNSFTNPNGYSQSFLSSNDNEFYFQFIINNFGDAFKYSVKISETNNQIKLDSIPNLRSHHFSGVGQRYAFLYDETIQKYRIYDSYRKTYLNTDYKNFIDIQEDDYQAYVICSDENNLIHRLNIVNGNLVSDAYVGDAELGYLNYIADYYIFQDKIFFTSETSYYLYCYNYTSKSLTGEKFDSPSFEYINDIVEFQNHLVLVTYAGVLYKNMDDM